MDKFNLIPTNRSQYPPHPPHPHVGHPHYPQTFSFEEKLKAAQAWYNRNKDKLIIPFTITRETLNLVLISANLIILTYHLKVWREDRKKRES